MRPSNAIVKDTYSSRLENYLYVYCSNTTIDEETKRLMSKNFNLTKENFNELRIQLINGNEDLFEQIFLTHFEACKSFLLIKYKCTPEDAYDATMDTLLVFRKKIIQGSINYDNLRFLFTKMASQTLVKDLGFRKKQDSVILQVEEENQDHVFELKTLNISWDKLGEKCKQLLKQYYYDNISLKEVAQEMDTNYIALRKQKERCIHRLRTLFTQYSKTF